MKLLFYSDMQLSGKRPRHRVDDYPRALVTKMAEVYATASRHGCEFVVFGGDFFNSHRVFSYELICDAMEIVCGSDLVTYAIVGQHDVYGYNPETFKSSTLAFMTRLCPQFKVLWEPTTHGCVRLHASHVWDDLENSRRVSFDGSEYVEVLVAHHLLSKGKQMFDVVSTADFGHGCPYDLVLSGDLHTGYPPHQVDSTWFANPGAMARQKIAEIERPVRCAVIDVELGVDPIIEYIPVVSAQPGTKVFGESFTEVVRGTDATTEFDPTTFLGIMEKFEATSADIYELVRQAAHEARLKPACLEYLMSKKS